MKLKSLIVFFSLIVVSWMCFSKDKAPMQGPFKKQTAKIKSSPQKVQNTPQKKKTELNKKEEGVDRGPQVKKFEFVGIKRISQDQLRKISAKYIHSPLYGSWTDSMIQEIQKISIVREVHLIRDMTGNITFEIVEKEPIAYLYLDRYYWMDEQAKIIQAIDPSELESKVFFSGPWKNQTDYERKNGPIIVLEGIKFYTALLAKEFPENKISEIHFDANLGWIMYRVGSRAPVVFGIQNLPQKIGRLIDVLPEITPMETIISRIDADFNDRVVVKLEVNESLGKLPELRH